MHKLILIVFDSPVVLLSLSLSSAAENVYGMFDLMECLAGFQLIRDQVSSFQTTNAHWVAWECALMPATRSSWPVATTQSKAEAGSYHRRSFEQEVVRA